MQNSALVQFLAAYGPTSDGNNMYDEFVTLAAQKAGVEPISIPESRSRLIVDDVRGQPGRSVILTGTAGDGKTYTARKAFAAMYGNPNVTLKDVEEWTDPSTGRRIVFVKDLTEIEASRKADLVPRMIRSFVTENPQELFVLCVNDGHLLRSWQEYMGDSQVGQDILATFRNLLRDDDDLPNGYSFRLVNMSRTSHASTIDAIIEQICDHPRWVDCGSQCTVERSVGCPIQINRKLLLQAGEPSMRARLKHLVELSAADGRHLSIRQIIILVVNALLGDSKNGYVNPLLNCARAIQRSADAEYKFTNPYNNVFGDNHPPSRRQQNAAFAALAEFGIGFETNNYFDDLLLDLDDRVDHSEYGTASYKNIRDSYLENPSSHIDELRKAITAQRRRLFFDWPDTTGDDRETSPWQLSVHSYGDLYLNLLKPEDSRNSDLFRKTRPRIIKGLNRALTGSLTETSDRLWLTQPSGVYKGADIPILVTSPIGWNSKPYYLNLVSPTKPGRPPTLRLYAVYPATSELASLPLTPSLFEYLMRVHDGALPMSFSNQCYQDVRNFQIRCVGQILQHERADGSAFKAVDAEGEQLAERSIGALEDEI